MKRSMETEGERIRAARKSRGLTQKQLAEKAGLATVTIQQYERNLRQPRLENIKKIALALNMLTDDLLSPASVLNPSDFDREKLEYWDPEFFTDYKINLDCFFRQLNAKGQAKALEQVRLLTRIPEYTEKVESRELEMYHRKEELEKRAAPPDREEPEALNAANDRGATPEEKKNADDIMHNPDEWE